MNDKEIEEADSFLEASKHAAKLGMFKEFFATFLNEIRNGNSVKDSIIYAFREWDL